MKTARMNHRVEPQLKEDFIQAAELDGKDASELVRSFMREYVEKTRLRLVSTSTPSISLKEQRKRREALDFAIASVGLEGFPVSSDFQAEGARFVRGEIELEDLKRFLDANAR